MNTHRIGAPLILALAAALLASCAKKAETPVAAPAPTGAKLVADAERSPSYDTVNSHLELGGTLYGYVDLDGDALEFASGAQSTLSQLSAINPQLGMLSKVDLKSLVTDLGLTDIRAIGLSSVKQADGLYRNRTFVYTPGGRRGLLAVLGGAPGKFPGTHLAPADADLFIEQEFDVVALYDTVKTLVGKSGGPEAQAKLDQALKGGGAQLHLSLLDLLHSLNGKATLILRVDPEKNLTTPGPKPVTYPAFSALVRIDGIGAALNGTLAANKNLEASTEPTGSAGTLTLYTSKEPAAFAETKYVFAVDGTALYFATSHEFLRESLDRKDGLDANPAFTAALEAAGSEGNGVTWVAPRLAARLHDLGTLNAGGPPEVAKLTALWSSQASPISHPLLTLRTNLPDGILVRSTWNRSLKKDVAMFAIYNPLTLGLIAAVAIPAFQQSHAHPQVAGPQTPTPQMVEVRINSNLRRLWTAANRYYQATGKTTATYNDLVGPGKAIVQLAPVAGEDYHSITFVKGQPHLRVVLPDGRAFVYPSGEPPIRRTPRPAAPSPAPEPPGSPGPAPAPESPPPQGGGQ